MLDFFATVIQSVDLDVYDSNMVEITYQMVLSTLQTAGLLVGISYYILTQRNQQKS